MVTAQWDVLIVDDDEDVGSAVAAALESDDIRAFRVRSGAAALDWLRENEPRLILIDLFMPELTGWDVVERLPGPRAHVPVILMSASDLLWETSVDPAVVLRKPFDVDDLLGAVRRFVPPA